MNKRTPTIGELMVGNTTPGQPDEGIEKAAAQAQVGDIFEGLTKEAKEDLVGTMGWAGRVFGEQISQALEPTVTKLAEAVAEIKVAAKATLQTNMENPEGYRLGKKVKSDAAGLPTGQLGMAAEHETNAPGAIKNTEGDVPGASGGWPTEKTRKELAQAKVVADSVAEKKGSAVLAHLQNQTPTQEKVATDDSLTDIGKKFQERLVADLNAE